VFPHFSQLLLAQSYIAFIMTAINSKSFGNLASEAHNLTHSYQN